MGVINSTRQSQIKYEWILFWFVQREEMSSVVQCCSWPSLHKKKGWSSQWCNGSWSHRFAMVSVQLYFYPLHNTVHVMSNEDHSLDCYRIVLEPYALAIFHTHASSQDTYTCRIWITSDASGCDSSTALIRLSALWEVTQRRAEHIL